MSGRWFCFLRAINTGARRVTNERLLRAFTTFGALDVAAYQAAGNVTFRTNGGVAPSAAELADHLGAELGFECPAFIRNGTALQSIAEQCPFTDADLAGTEGRVQIAFLERAAGDEAVNEVRSLVPADDLVVLTGTEWWWLPKAGISDSELPVRQVETILGPMTMRTKATIDRMLARFAT